MEIRRDLVSAEEGLAEADQAGVGVEADEAEVGELAELDGLEAGDAHRIGFLLADVQPLMAPLVRPLTK